MDVRLLAAVCGELDGLNVAGLCREHGISRKTFYKWRARYQTHGLEGLEPRSRRPNRSPTRFADHVEDAIVECRKQLLSDGFDAGAASIAWHLRGRVSPVPSEATIWRILTQRGFVVPEPRKRPAGRGGGSRRHGRTSAGRSTPPTGRYAAARWRSSTSSTTTPGYSSPRSRST